MEMHCTLTVDAKAIWGFYVTTLDIVSGKILSPFQ